MTYSERWKRCNGCKRWIRKRCAVRATVYCPECNQEHVKNAAMQLAAKSGPYYDRWLETRGPQGRPRTD